MHEEILLAALPVAAAAGAGINWLYQRKRNKRADQVEDQGRHKQELDELAPSLATLRREYTEAVNQIVELLERLRAISEENVRMTHDRAVERLALIDAILLQAVHIDEIRGRFTTMGLELPPRPKISEVAQRLVDLHLGDTPRPDPTKDTPR